MSHTLNQLQESTVSEKSIVSCAHVLHTHSVDKIHHVHAICSESCDGNMYIAWAQQTLVSSCGLCNMTGAH